MNPLAINYNPDAEEDDGSCLILGCTNPTMFNYDPNANTDNGGCIPFSLVVLMQQCLTITLMQILTMVLA